MNYWELVLGAIIGTVTSALLAEFYQRRANRELDARIEKLQELHDNLDRQLQDAVYFAEMAADKSTEAWRASVRGTAEDPDFPYK